MSILRNQSVKFIRNRHIFVRSSVIKSLKDVRVYASEVPKEPKNFHSNTETETSSSIANWLKLHYDRFIGTYEILSGMKEIRAAQAEVVNIQEKLKEAQNQRRVFQQNVMDISKNIQMLNNDIHAMDKGNPHYLELVKRQIELMQKKNEVDRRFDFTDTTERDLFTHLTSAVKTSHEIERYHAENAKQFSIIVSLVAAILGILGTVLAYHLRNNQFRSISEQGEKIEQALQELRKEVKQSFIDLQSRVEPLVESAIKKSLKQKKTEQRESWTAYFSRHTNSVYRWFIPKK